MVLPTTLVMASVRQPLWRASLAAARVSAVSPDWVTSTVRGLSPVPGEYRYSDASSTVVGSRAIDSMMYLPTIAAL